MWQKLQPDDGLVRRKRMMMQIVFLYDNGFATISMMIPPWQLLCSISLFSSDQRIYLYLNHRSFPAKDVVVLDVFIVIQNHNLSV